MENHDNWRTGNTLKHKACSTGSLYHMVNCPAEPMIMTTCINRISVFRFLKTSLCCSITQLVDEWFLKDD